MIKQMIIFIFSVIVMVVTGCKTTSPNYTTVDKPSRLKTTVNYDYDVELKKLNDIYRRKYIKEQKYNFEVYLLSNAESQNKKAPRVKDLQITSPYIISKKNKKEYVSLYSKKAHRSTQGSNYKIIDPIFYDLTSCE